MSLAFEHDGKRVDAISFAEAALGILKEMGDPSASEVAEKIAKLRAEESVPS